jgi:phosphatidylglycerophosphatase A
VTAAFRTVASVGGIGLLPRGPATVAAFVGGAAFFLAQPGLEAQAVLTVLVIGIGQVCAVRLATEEELDPRYLVIDEVAGVWVALLGLSLDFATCLIGTVGFRVLDRLKPWPIRRVGDKGGRFAVMGDDIVAGLLTNVLIRLGLEAHGRLA